MENNEKTDLDHATTQIVNHNKTKSLKQDLRQCNYK